MAKKTKNVVPCPNKILPIDGKTEAECTRLSAALLCGPEFAALRVIRSVDEKNYGQLLDVPAVVTHLRLQASVVQGGDMAGTEAMLMNQATALQSLFARLIERGMDQTIMPNMEGFLKLGLRAQNQCRATLETLAAIKNPPVVFAKQANITNGPQQVNNGIEAPRAQENKIEQTKLLEAIPNERLDFGEKATASETNQAMATVGTVHRAKDNSRQKDSFPERI